MVLKIIIYFIQSAVKFFFFYKNQDFWPSLEHFPKSLNWESLVNDNIFFGILTSILVYIICLKLEYILYVQHTLLYLRSYIVCALINYIYPECNKVMCMYLKYIIILQFMYPLHVGGSKYIITLPQLFYVPFIKFYFLCFHAHINIYLEKKPHIKFYYPKALIAFWFSGCHLPKSPQSCTHHTNIHTYSKVNFRKILFQGLHRNLSHMHFIYGI